jgi:hypothetical protein
MPHTCRMAEATYEDGPRLASGCTENRVIVREDLIRRMNLSDWATCSYFTEGAIFRTGWMLLLQTPLYVDLGSCSHSL